MAEYRGAVIRRVRDLLLPILSGLIRGSTRFDYRLPLMGFNKNISRALFVDRDPRT